MTPFKMHPSALGKLEVTAYPPNMELCEQHIIPRPSSAQCFLGWGRLEAHKESNGPTYTCNTLSHLLSQHSISAVLSYLLKLIHFPQPLFVAKKEGGRLGSVPDSLQSTLL